MSTVFDKALAAFNGKKPKTEKKPAKPKAKKPAKPKAKKPAKPKAEKKPAKPKAEKKPAKPKAEKKPAKPKAEKKPKAAPEIYASTYCNHGHNMKTGKPVGHECRTIPPAALRAEREGDYAKAIEIMKKRKK